MLELRKRADRSGEPPAEGEPWPLASVELVGKAPAVHNFADQFVARAIGDGYLEFENAGVAMTPGYERNPVVAGSAIVLHLAAGDLIYDVLEHPGRYERSDGTVEVHHEYRCKLRGAGRG